MGQLDGGTNGTTKGTHKQVKASECILQVFQESGSMDNKYVPPHLRSSKDRWARQPSQQGAGPGLWQPSQGPMPMAGNTTCQGGQTSSPKEGHCHSQSAGRSRDIISQGRHQNPTAGLLHHTTRNMHSVERKTQKSTSKGQHWSLQRHQKFHIFGT